MAKKKQQEEYEEEEPKKKWRLLQLENPYWWIGFIGGSIAFSRLLDK